MSTSVTSICTGILDISFRMACAHDTGVEGTDVTGERVALTLKHPKSATAFVFNVAPLDAWPFSKKLPYPLSLTATFSGRSKFVQLASVQPGYLRVEDCTYGSADATANANSKRWQRAIVTTMERGDASVHRKAI